MRALVFAAIITTSSIASAGGALEVKIAPPKKGEIADVVSRVSSDMQGSVNGHKTAQTSQLDEAWTQEALAVDKDVLTKERVSFTAAHQKLGGDATKDVDLPILNKTYVAIAADGKLTFTDDKGGKLDEAVVKLLAQTIDNVGERDKLGALFGGKSFSKGVAVRLSSAELISLMGGGDQLPTSSMLLTLVENDGKRARFEIAGTMDGGEHGEQVSAAFSGTVTIDLALGRMVDFDLSAQVKTTMIHGKDTTEIEMKLDGHKSMTYR
jgi:hypothetical protein